ncbi:OLC1v1025533C1 [Oldenlandia corymbosa var. corymbosa]|uniref:OLC1v1025533C1 n=1 Tax=Oldenlandia corymbosa var. corymbosa TaxID=529605 RepID=A0AAV1C6H4_OLDCO|nr:OLC1v1025533C1 [Oldenlandia corymbosa var. corymbosa]
MARNVSYMLHLYHTSKYVIENGSINTFSNMPDDDLFVEESLGGRRVVKIKNDSHVEFMNRVDPMSCLDLYMDLEDITQEEREASLENVSFSGFPRGERASTSRNRDEEETPLFAQDDYREESDSDYIALSESEEDCDVSGKSNFEESDDERLENEERDCNPLPRRHVYSKMGKWDASCVDKDEFTLKILIRRKVEDNVDYTVASAQKDVKTLLKVDVPYKRAWHGRRKAIEAVYGDWTSNFEELPWYIATFKFTNHETVVEWEWKEGQEDEELDKHLDDIINQTHADLTLGANDEMEVEDIQILVDKDSSLPSQPPPGKKAKPWSRDKIRGGRKRKVPIPPRTSQQQTEGQQNEDQTHSSRGSRIQVETQFEDISGPETEFDLGGLKTQFGGQSQPQPGVKFLTMWEFQSQPQPEP